MPRPSCLPQALWIFLNVYVLKEVAQKHGGLRILTLQFGTSRVESFHGNRLDEADAYIIAFFPDFTALDLFSCWHIKNAICVSLLHGTPLCWDLLRGWQLLWVFTLAMLTNVWTDTDTMCGGTLRYPQWTRAGHKSWSHNLPQHSCASCFLSNLTLNADVFHLFTVY